MNKFPIKIELIEHQAYNVVEWMLGNTCNYDCSFCANDSKAGDKKYLDINVYIETCKKIIKESGDKKVWFKITGGEPTLYPNLVELLSYIKSTGNYTYLITNGSRTLRWWQDFKEANCIDFIAVTVHPEQNADINHLIQVINLFEKTETYVIANITCPVAYFKQALQAFSEIYKNCAVILSLQQINDPSKMSLYSKAQLETLLLTSNKTTPSYHKKLKNNIPKKYQYSNGITQITYNDGSVISDLANNFIKRVENSFNGYECDIGKNLIRISHDTVQRGICGVGEQWSIYDENLFRLDSVECSRTSCDCSLDFIQTKKYK